MASGDGFQIGRTVVLLPTVGSPGADIFGAVPIFDVVEEIAVGVGQLSAVNVIKFCIYVADTVYKGASE